MGYILSRGYYKHYGFKRLPRKTKKKVKASLSVTDKRLKRSLTEMYWMYLVKTKPEFVSYIIKNICESYGN